jgi:cell division protein FtsQ
VTAGVALDPVTAPADSPRAVRPRRQRVLRAAAAGLVASLAVSSPWWGPPALSQLDFFHVRRVEFDGVRYARAADLVRTLGVDTTQSVWQSLPDLARRVAKHPLIAAAAVERRMPGTLVVHVVERQPIALVLSRGVLRPADASGVILPIDPARVPMDVPVASSADSTLLHLLDGLRVEAPTLYARVTQAQRVNSNELRLFLGSVTVRMTPDVTVSRIKDILPVEADLARNQLRAVELDLRFRDQVIARQP